MTELVKFPPPGSSKAMVEDILAAAKEIPSLMKGDRNKHGNYAFVSIDDYYEKAAPVLRKHNISWSVRETSAEVLEVGEKWDAASSSFVSVRAVQFCYEFDLYHPSCVVPAFFTVSVLHPLQGAQTSGSAMSYASKMFIRNVFSVVTGEQEADSTSPSAFDFGGAPPPPKPTPPQPKADIQSAGDIQDVYDMAKIFIDTCKTEVELQEFWAKNTAQFNGLKASAPNKHKLLVAMFRKAKEQIIAGEPVTPPTPEEPIDD